MKWSPLLGCCILAALAGLQVESLAQRRAGAAPEYFKVLQSQENKGSLTRAVLHNGLTVLIEEQPLDPLVAVLVYVKSGYGQLSSDDRGISRLLGQLYTYRSPVVDEIKDEGALFRVRAGPDSTVLSAIGPAEKLTELLELQADLLKTPDFEVGKIEWEAQALAQRSQAERMRPEWAFEWQSGEPIDPLPEAGGDPAVDEPELFSFQEAEQARQKLTQFHARYYQPANLILSVSGQVRREQVLEKVAEFYASMKAVKGEKPLLAASGKVSAQSSFRYRHLRGEGRHFIRLSYQIPGRSSKDYQPLLLLSYVLGEGHGAPLKRLMLGEQGSAFDVRVKMEAFRSGGTFSISLHPYPEKVDRAEVQVLSHLQRLKSSGISAGQSERAKALLLKDHYKRLQSLEERAYLLADHQSLGSYLNRDRLAEQLEAITPQQISAVLGRYFGESNLSLLESFPKTAETRTFTAESLLESLRLLVKAELQAPMNTVLVLPGQEKEWMFRVPGLTRSYLKYEVKKTSILRGPDIYFQREHVLPLVHLGFFFPGGRVAESKENAGITELMLRVLFRNAAARSDSWVELEGLGSEITFVNEMDFFGIRAVLLSNRVEAFFEALLEWIRRPAVTQADVDLERRRMLEILEREGEDPFLTRVKAAKEQMFPEHPYGLNRYGSRESVSGLSLESVQDWLTSQMRTIHPLIVVRGDIEGTAFLYDFISDLSDSKREKREPVAVKNVKSLQRSVLDTEGEEILLVSRGPAKGSREEALLDVVETALGGRKGSLSASLRNEQGVIREIRMFRQAGLNGGAILVRISTPEGKQEAALTSLREELDKLGRVPPSQLDFLPTLVGTLTRFYLDQQRGQDSIVELTRNLMAGQGPEYARRYLSRVKNASRSDVLLQVKRYLPFGKEEQPER